MAVSCQGDGSGSGVVSLVPAGSSDPNRVQQMSVGDRPYGLLWLSDTDLLVCNEGLAAIAGNPFLQYVRLSRGSADPNDPGYDVLQLPDANDANAVTIIGVTELYGPSEAVPLPGTNVLVVVSLRFLGAVYLVDLTSSSPSWQRLLGSVTVEEVDEPRGVDVTSDGTRLFICNYGSGANHTTCLALSKSLIAAKLNRLRGVVPDDPTALDQTIGQADLWLANHRDPDGQLPYRWPEPDEGPDDAAIAEANDLTSSLQAFNNCPSCTDPNDPNCPLTPDAWAGQATTTWPIDPNIDPNFPALVVGDANDPNHNYDYATLLAILQRPDQAQGEVTVYHMGFRQVIARITVPPRPRSVRITPDDGMAVVTCSGQDGKTGSVVVIDLSTLSILVQRDLDFVPALVRLHPLGARAYISAWTGNRMAVVNLNELCTGTATGSAADVRFYTVFDRPAAIDFAEDEDLLWCGSPGLNQVAPLDVFEGIIRIP